MPTDCNPQGAGSFVEDRGRARRRWSKVACSWFVLASFLGAGLLNSGAVWRLSVSLEAGFQTVDPDQAKRIAGSAPSVAADEEAGQLSPLCLCRAEAA
tara:strand:- start:1557 stop:1850 length:294 start_codon:yes stop_codon:yes gene_type:complete